MSEQNENTEIKGVTWMGLRFDNHISIGHIVTTVALIIACVTWKNGTDNEIYNLKQKDVQLERQDDELRGMIVENRTDYRNDIRDIRALLQTISDKIDKKADRKP